MMASIQFKGLVKFDSHNFSQSSIQLQARHAKKGWRPVFEITAQDMINLFTKKHITKRKSK